MSNFPEGDFAAKTARELATQFMKLCSNRWVDISIEEGWTHNLRELARSMVYETWRRQSMKMNRPEQTLTLVELDQALKVNEDDHAYFKNYGRDLNRVDLFYICEARSNRTGKDYEILNNPPPSVTMTTDELMKAFKASMIEMDKKSQAFGRKPRGV